MITCNPETALFTIQTRHTTYQMKVDTHGILLHTWYGPRVDGDMSYLIRYADRGFSPNPPEAGTDRTYSLDTLPLEFSGWGCGDYRVPSLELELPSGNHVAELRYSSHRVIPGKYGLEGLPAFFGDPDKAETLVIRLVDTLAQIAVDLYYGVFEDSDLICRATQVVNLGRSPVTLLRCASLCLDFHRADMDLITFDGSHTLERAPFRAPLRPGCQGVTSVRGMSSHQHNPFVVLCDHNTDENQGLAYGAMLLYSGNFEATAEYSQYERARLHMGIHTRQFRWTLNAGDCFTTPEAALTCSSEGFGGMSRQLHRAIREHLLRDPWAGKRKPVLVNSWEAAYMDFDMERLLSLARAAADMGVELFVLDDGWFGQRNDDNSSLGDWKVNEKKLPGGLKALSAKLKEMNLSFGLWIEPEMVNENSDLYRAHSEWVLHTPEREYVRARNQLVLDLTRPEVRDYLFTSIRDALKDTDIRYLKWDMNRGLTQVFSASLPPERQGEVYHRYVLGVYELLERFRAEWPEVLIEGCAGGGGRFDAGMLYYCPQIWCSDNTDAVDRLTIQMGTSFAYPPCTMGAHVSAVPNAQNGRVTSMATRGAVALAGTFGYELDLRHLNPEERVVATSQIADYKRYWSLVQNGDYYRLTDAFAPTPYTAWAHIAPDRREAMAILVTGSVRSAAPFRALQLRGLDPDLTYMIESTGEKYTGRQLMEGGYPLPLSLFWGDYQALKLHLIAQ